MLGFEVAQATVSRYMPLRRKPPSQTWRSFLRNHTKDLVSIDFFVVPTATFRVLYVFLVLEHERRRIAHFNVTDGPSAQWTGQQLVNAFPYHSAPKYVIRDRDKIYGADFVRRMRAMGIEQFLTAPQSPWQNPYCERVTGPFGGTASTTSSFSESSTYGASCASTSSTITDLGPTSGSTRTPPNPANASPSMEGKSSRSRWSADCIIATRDAQPERKSRSHTTSGVRVRWRELLSLRGR
jgi:hypothetical protein